MKLKVWTCSECGHEAPVNKVGDVFSFNFLGPTASIVSCKACKSATIQKATDTTFRVGDFIVIKTKNKIRGK